MGHEEHHEKARGPVVCAVITVSDTRTEENDTSGRLIRELLEAKGHTVVASRIVPDNPQAITAALFALSRNCQAILLNGGTGISTHDLTYEAVTSRFDKFIPGFGELFRILSYAEIGPAAMLSRAAAGVSAGRLVLMMPGSTAAVRLAMEKLILPEISHMVWEMER